MHAQHTQIANCTHLCFEARIAWLKALRGIAKPTGIKSVLLQVAVKRLQKQSGSRAIASVAMVAHASRFEPGLTVRGKVLHKILDSLCRQASRHTSVTSVHKVFQKLQNKGQSESAGQTHQLASSLQLGLSTSSSTKCWWCLYSHCCSCRPRRNGQQSQYNNQMAWLSI